jgi:hypothetical protein
MVEFENKFKKTESLWIDNIDLIRFNFSIRLGAICVGSIIYSFLLIYIYSKYRKQKMMIEAFFKFEKEDL